MVDIVSCVKAGQCAVISNWQYYMTIGVYALFGIAVIMVVMVKIFTPALTFLKAKLKKRYVLYGINRAQQGEFLVAKSNHQGMLETKAGPFIMSENSHIIDKASKVPIFWAHLEHAATIPDTYPMMLQELRLAGFKVDTWKDLEVLTSKKSEFFGEEVLQKDVEDGKISEKQAETLKKMGDELDTFMIRFRPYRTIPLHEVTRMFPFNISPALIESKEQHALAMKQKMWGGVLNKQFAIVVAVILMSAALAFVIIWKLTTGNAPPTVEVKITQDMLKTAATTAGNLTF